MNKYILAALVLLGVILYCSQSTEAKDDTWNELATSKAAKLAQRYVDTRKHNPFSIVYWTKGKGASSKSSSSESSESKEHRHHKRKRHHRQSSSKGEPIPVIVGKP